MQHILSSYSENIEPFAWMETVFNEQQLDWLQDQAKNYNEKAAVGSGGEGIVNSNVRRAGIRWLGNNSETSWVYEILANVVSTLNAQFFRFYLTGFHEAYQLTNYDSSEQGMYGWHIDMSSSPTAPCRKLSLVLQLSDPKDYDGGNLELQPSGSNIIKIKKQRGLVVCFPSWTLHQVTPVTTGNRQTLVSWINGPQFK